MPDTITTTTASFSQFSTECLPLTQDSDDGAPLTKFASTTVDMLVMPKGSSGGGHGVVGGLPVRWRWVWLAARPMSEAPIREKFRNGGGGVAANHLNLA